MNRLVIIPVLAAVAVLLFFSMGFFSGQERERRYLDGQGDKAYRNLSEYANDSEVQALLGGLREAKMAGDREKIENITLELEKMGVEMPSGRGSRDFSPGDI